MTAPDLKCECGTVLADGGPVGLYCPNRECRIEQDMAAKAYKAMRDRKRLAEALAVPEVKALVEAAKDRLHWLDEDTGEYCGCGACEPLYTALAALRAIGEGKA